MEFCVFNMGKDFESRDEFEKFVDGFRGVATLVRENSPDYIFAPVVGAVPFVDILSIVDQNFPLEDVCYLPNSSRFGN